MLFLIDLIRLLGNQWISELHISKTRLSVMHRIYFIAVHANGLVTLFNQSVAISLISAQRVISRPRETALIGSDRSHCCIDPPANHYRCRDAAWIGKDIRARIGRRIYFAWVRQLRKISKARCGVAYWLTRLLPDQEARVEKKKRTRRRTEAKVEQATGARREGVMKHRADTPPWIFII